MVYFTEIIPFGFFNMFVDNVFKTKTKFLRRECLILHLSFIVTVQCSSRNEPFKIQILQIIADSEIMLCREKTHNFSKQCTNKKLVHMYTVYKWGSSGNFSIRFGKQYMSLFASIAAFASLLLTSDRKSSR